MAPPRMTARVANAGTGTQPAADEPSDKKRSKKSADVTIPTGICALCGVKVPQVRYFTLRVFVLRGPQF